MALACLMACTAWASDIVIRSGEGEDTVMQAGPGVGSGAGNMRMESDPDNGTMMQVTPVPREHQDDAYQGPLIITPEIHMRRRQ